MVIGANGLSYKELVPTMAKCHKTIEVIRKHRPGHRPGLLMPWLRTDPGNPVATPGSLWQASYLQKLSQLMITHS